MASIYYLLDDAVHIEHDIVQQYSERANTLKETYHAALTVQRYYRGYLIRKRIKHWHTAATILQKHVRGWLVRYKMPDLWHQEYDRRCLLYYNKMATRIQALWRGASIRKIIPIKELLEEKHKQEEKIRKMSVSIDIRQSDQDKQGETIKKETIDRDFGKNIGCKYDDGRYDEFFMKQISQMLFDRHHLLSTCTKKGILKCSKRNQCKPFDIEKVLASISWKEYMKELRSIYKDKTQNLKCGHEQYPYIFQDQKLRKQEDLLRMKYKDTKDMPFLYEFEDDLKDDKKMFILNSKLKKPSYERQLIAQEKYKVLEKNIVRTIDPSKNISETDFKLAFKDLVKKSDVLSYFCGDFLCQKCSIHYIESQK